MRVRNFGSSPPRHRVETDATPINDDTELKLASVIPETLQQQDDKPEVLLQADEQLPKIQITVKTSEEKANSRYKLAGHFGLWSNYFPVGTVKFVNFCVLSQGRKLVYSHK